MYAEAFLEPVEHQGGVSLQKSQESFVVDNRLGSNCASGIGFTEEKIYRMSIFIWYDESRLQNSVITLFLKLIKKHLGLNSFMTEVSIIKKPVRWFALHEWMNTPVKNELTKKV